MDVIAKIDITVVIERKELFPGRIHFSVIIDNKTDNAYPKNKSNFLIFRKLLFNCCRPTRTNLGLLKFIIFYQNILKRLFVSNICMNLELF